MGIVFLNVMSFYLVTADALLAGIIFLMVVILYPNFVTLVESPLWLLRQKKYIQAVDSLEVISRKNKRHLPRLFFSKLLHALENNQFVHKEDESSKKLSILDKLRLLFLNRDLRNQLVILCTVSSSLYCVYYGIVTSVQDLGLKTFQYNGILVGITQAAGFVGVLGFLPVRKRKASLLVIQSVLLLGAFLLVCLSFLEKTPLVRDAEGAVSAILISTAISALFSFLYVANAESFPTQIRGLAVGTILLAGKLIGSCSPYFNLLSKQMKVHVLTGASLPLFVSLMTTMFLRETLVKDSKNKAAHK